MLRYGSFYGPETSTGEGGEIVEMVRRRQFPVLGGGAGVWSFIHIDDAARATLLAIERGAGGTYNIVDDEPAEVSLWLPDLAAALGAKPPYRAPRMGGKNHDRRGGAIHDDADSRIFEREGQTRFGLVSGICQLARRLPSRPQARSGGNH